MRSYIVRDLLIWFLLLVLVPAVVFVVYYFTTGVSNTTTTATATTKDSVLKNLVPSLVAHPSQSQADISSNNDQQLMKRIQLSEALCNDGSPATYYIKRSRTNSSEWVIVLEGGYFCYDEHSCRLRALNSANLTTSRFGKRFKRGRGLLSSRQDENPYWHTANLV